MRNYLHAAIVSIEIAGIFIFAFVLGAITTMISVVYT